MRREGKFRSSDTTRKICSFYLVLSMIFAGFTVMVIIVPYSIKAAGPAPRPVPLYKNVTCSNDTFLAESQPYVNKDGLTYLQVDPRTGGLQRNRFILNFSMPSLPSGYKIHNASLHLWYYDNQSTNPDSRVHRCWELNRSWRESQAAWWRRWTGQAWDNGLVSPVQDYRNISLPKGWDAADYVDQETVGIINRWKVWNVTASVKRFYAGTFPNYGWIIDDANEVGSTNYIVRYYSSDNANYKPYLLINYTTLPSCTTKDAFSINDTRAYFYGNVTAAGASSVSAGFYYSTTTPVGTGNNVSASGYYLNGADFSYQKTSLSRGTMYYFKAWVKNPGFFVTASSEKKFLTAPASLTGFDATAYNTTQINLTWTNGGGGVGAYIEYRSASPSLEWEPKTGYGTAVNASGYIPGISFVHGSLSSGQTYWYKAWPYASDDGWKSSGNATSPFGTDSSDSDTTPTPDSGSWIGITGLNLYSSCGGTGLSGALYGNNTWTHSAKETHWFVIDLGRKYTITKFRGRSLTTKDPFTVDIYISNSSTLSWGSAVATNIGTWQDTSSWVEYDSTNKIGRYIKINITATEDSTNKYINWGGTASPFQILDAYGTVKIENATYYFDNYDHLECWKVSPELMVDGAESKYASTPDFRSAEKCDRNTCPGTDLGTISTVKIRAKGYWFMASNTITLRPIFGGKDFTGSYLFSCGSSSAWSAWFDITNDTIAPDEWSWSDVRALCCDVESGVGGAKSELFCSKVEIKVDYIPLGLNVPPVASFFMSNNPVTTGENVTFTSDSYDQDGTITNYSWDKYNDGATDGYGEAIDFAYPLAGKYTVKLTIEDNRGGTSYKTDIITVTQTIDLIRNSFNNGDNYITWGLEQTTAMTLAKLLKLGEEDSISKFDPTVPPRHCWDIYYWIKGAEDFTINTWDSLLIRVDHSISGYFTPEGTIDSTQSKTLSNFADNGGWAYITWSKEYTITASDFIDDMGLDGENIEINVYDTNTGAWSNHNPSLPPEFQDDFIIYPYDTICFRVPSVYNEISYDTNNFP